MHVCIRVRVPPGYDPTNPLRSTGRKTPGNTVLGILTVFNGTPQEIDTTFLALNCVPS